MHAKYKKKTEKKDDINVHDHDFEIKNKLIHEHDFEIRLLNYRI